MIGWIPTSYRAEPEPGPGRYLVHANGSGLHIEATHDGQRFRDARGVVIDNVMEWLPADDMARARESRYQNSI